MLGASAGLAGAWGAMLAVRLGYGMLVIPRTLNLNAVDVAANSVSRLRMMGRDYPLDHMPIFDAMSRMQGHARMVKRVADLAPVIPK